MPPLQEDLFSRTDLPEELQSKLIQPRPDDTSDRIAAIVNGRDGECSIDDVLVAYYRLHGEILERAQVNGKLKKLAADERILQLPHRKAVYVGLAQAEVGADSNGDDQDA